jgi:hypothetical protein
MLINFKTDFNSSAEFFANADLFERAFKRAHGCHGFLTTLGSRFPVTIVRRGYDRFWREPGIWVRIPHEHRQGDARDPVLILRSSIRAFEFG